MLVFSDPSRSKHHRNREATLSLQMMLADGPNVCGLGAFGSGYLREADLLSNLEIIELTCQRRCCDENGYRAHLTQR